MSPFAKSHWECEVKRASLIFSGCPVSGVGGRGEGKAHGTAQSASVHLSGRFPVETREKCGDHRLLPDPSSLRCSIEQPGPRGLATPRTYLDGSIADGEKLGWNVSLPEGGRALLPQDLPPGLQDPMVLGVGVPARQALDLKLEQEMQRSGQSGRGWRRR